MTDEQIEPTGTDGETKHDKFIRIANYRLAKAVERMRLMRNLASNNYEYSVTEAQFLIDALDLEVSRLRDALLVVEEDEFLPQLPGTASPVEGSDFEIDIDSYVEGYNAGTEDGDSEG